LPFLRGLPIIPRIFFIVRLCRFATSPVLRDPVVRKNYIEVRGRHSDFAALRHDVLKRFI
jgi:hypothetical protein